MGSVWILNCLQIHILVATAHAFEIDAFDRYWDQVYPSRAIMEVQSAVSSLECEDLCLSRLHDGCSSVNIYRSTYTGRLICQLSRDVDADFLAKMIPPTASDYVVGFVKVKPSKFGESCPDSYRKGYTHVGRHMLRDVNNDTYSAFCQYNNDGTGWMFPTRTTINTRRLQLTSSESILVRFINADNTQSDTLLEQLPAFSATPLVVIQDAYTGYTYVRINSLGSTYLHLGFIPAADPENRRGVTHGYRTNGVSITYRNCDGNPASHMAFYPNIGGGTCTNRPAAIDNQWLNTRQPTAANNYLKPVTDYLFTAEIGMGGCGSLSCTQTFGVQGVAIGIPFSLV